MLGILLFVFIIITYPYHGIAVILQIENVENIHMEIVNSDNYIHKFNSSLEYGDETPGDYAIKTKNNDLRVRENSSVSHRPQ